MQHRCRTGSRLPHLYPNRCCAVPAAAAPAAPPPSFSFPPFFFAAAAAGGVGRCELAPLSGTRSPALWGEGGGGGHLHFNLDYNFDLHIGVLQLAVPGRGRLAVC